MKYILLSFLYLLSLDLFAQEIKIYTWENYISQRVIDNFENETGNSIKLYYYDNETNRDAILTTPNIAGKYDLILVDSQAVQRYSERGWLQSLPSIANVENNSQQSINACTQYGIPYGQGTMGIIYRSSVSKTKITSWNDLLKPPQEHIGTTMMIDDWTDTVAMALLAQGFDPFTNNKNELKSAFSLLEVQSNSLMAYGYPQTYTAEQGKNSKLTLAALYSGDLHNIKKNTGQDDWVYVVPKEGTLFFVDCLTAPSEHKISEATKAFIAYLNEPAVAYKNASDIWFPTTNKGALLIADDKYKNDSEIFPDTKILQIQRSYSYQRLSEEAIMMRNRISAILTITSNKI